MAKVNWMDVEMDKNPDVMIIDIGYVNDEPARNRADEIFALGIGKKNLVCGPSAGKLRIHMNIPKSKQKMILAALPIQAKKSWFGATHSYLGKGKS